jgi:hypothetical protein
LELYTLFIALLCLPPLLGYIIGITLIDPGVRFDTRDTSIASGDLDLRGDLDSYGDLDLRGDLDLCGDLDLY